MFSAEYTNKDAVFSDDWSFSVCVVHVAEVRTRNGRMDHEARTVCILYRRLRVDSGFRHNDDSFIHWMHCCFTRKYGHDSCGKC